MEHVPANSAVIYPPRHHLPLSTGRRAARHRQQTVRWCEVVSIRPARHVQWTKEQSHKYPEERRLATPDCPQDPASVLVQAHSQ